MTSKITQVFIFILAMPFYAMPQACNLERFVMYLSDVYSITAKEPARTMCYRKPLEKALAFAQALSRCMEADSQALSVELFETEHRKININSYPSNFASTYEWPSPRTVSLWRKSIKQLETKLSSFEAQVYAKSNEQNRAIATTKELCHILISELLTDGFFWFSFKDKAFDFFVDHPVAFAKSHPYVTAGITTVVTVGGYFLYTYLIQTPPAPISPVRQQLPVRRPRGG